MGWIPDSHNHNVQCNMNDKLDSVVCQQLCTRTQRSGEEQEEKFRLESLNFTNRVFCPPTLPIFRIQPIPTISQMYTTSF